MSDEQNTSEQPKAPAPIEPADKTSAVFGISVRGWIALFLVWTICGMSIARIEVIEPLYSMGSLALGFYFGQKINKA